MTTVRGWEKRPLGKILRVASGAFLPAKALGRHGTYAVYGGNGINGRHTECMFESPVLVLGRVGVYCGVVHRTEPKSWVTDNALVVTDIGDDIDMDYLGHALRAADLNQYASRSAQPLISGSRIYPVEVLVPPLPEQRRIAAILDKADSIRRKRQETIRLTEEFLRSAFLDMFGDPVTNPKGWPRGTMSDVIADTQYGTSDRANTKRQGLPVLRMNNITYTGALDLTDLKWCAIKVRDREKYTVRNGDLLFNRTNSPELVGKTAVWDRDDQFAYAGYLVRVRFRPGTLAEYISAWLNSQYGKSYLFEKAKPSNNMSNFSASLFRTIPVLLPPADLQARFASVVRKVGMMTEQFRQLHATTEDLSRSLTQRAFSGEL